MSSTTTRRAARSLGGIVMQPPMSREAASEYLETEISLEAWSKVAQAFCKYGFSLDDLNASRASKSKDPTKASWTERQKLTVNALEGAMDRLQATRKHGEFLREASENYCQAEFGYSFSSEVSADRLLNEAYRKIFDAIVIIERAEPIEVEVPTNASARAILAIAIRDALSEDGIKTQLSDRRTLPDDASEADLTPFEQLLSALGVHEGETPTAVARWIHRAVTNPK